jgi:hypothetical protein
MKKCFGNSNCIGFQGNGGHICSTDVMLLAQFIPFGQKIIPMELQKILFRRYYAMCVFVFPLLTASSSNPVSWKS